MASDAPAPVIVRQKVDKYHVPVDSAPFTLLLGGSNMQSCNATIAHVKNSHMYMLCEELFLIIINKMYSRILYQNVHCESYEIRPQTGIKRMTVVMSKGPIGSEYFHVGQSKKSLFSKLKYVLQMGNFS